MANMNSTFTIHATAAVVAAALMCASSLPASAATPSFACTGNLLPTEAVICSDDSLAALDRALAAAYKNDIDKLAANQRGAVENAEKTWIAERNSCGTNKSCITNAYHVRITALTRRPLGRRRPAAPPIRASCTGKLDPAEATICSDVTLAALDRTLAADYKVKSIVSPRANGARWRARKRPGSPTATVAAPTSPASAMLITSASMRWSSPPRRFRSPPRAHRRAPRVSAPRSRRSMSASASRSRRRRVRPATPIMPAP